ncbi:pseudouridine synthase [Sediminibacterium roseum]|uniref:Pseudouridine synthase n=1 Tax=Sediminibacterium roseum TaxID=1978412 RepID=A0ABX0A423_9BACT|nr:pseudouridine synthase [Sediminibacterium roseum]NCI51906.1 pseudouridine synthase [Sediminibacterium roseum]
MNYYFIIYKPYLVLSQFSPVEEKKTLADFFDVPKDVYPVGRLDHDSEGLLLLTNDKQLNHRLLDPKFAHKREYWVQVDGAVTNEAINRLRKTVAINVDGKLYNTKPCEVFLLDEEPPLPEREPPIRFRKEIPAPWLRMILAEGKNRQVRKMTAKVGFPTLRLVRYRVEGLSIDGMQPGGLKQLDQHFVYEQLFYGNKK